MTLFLVLTAPFSAHAVPDDLVYSARALDSAGAPIDGSHDVTLRLWPAVGDAVWSQDFQGVPFSAGYFSVVLDGGTLTDTTLLAPELFVGIEIDGAGEIGLRTPLYSAPYARMAGGVRLSDITAPCSPSVEGTLRLHSGSVEACIGTTWTPIGGNPTGTLQSPARSCKALNEDWPTFPSAVYWVDPSGGTSAAFEVYCDMSTSGGGWTRVGTIDASIYVCSLVNALGTSSAVASSTGTAWLSAAVAQTLAADNEVLIATSASSWTHYRSTNPSFTWTNVANGNIGTSSNTAYGVTYMRSADSGFNALPDGSCSAVAGADCLIGGYLGASPGWTHVLGIGSHTSSNTHDQIACQSALGSAWRGILQGGSWGQAGEVYVR